MRGRKPKPTELKKLSGNPGKRKLPEHEPALPIEAPDMPAWLDDEAQAEWNRIIPLLQEMRILTKAYRAALAAYCETWSTYVRAAESVMETGGEIVRSPSGFPIQNPYASVRNTAKKQLMLIAAEFGLTASAKPRVKAEAPAKGAGLKLFAAKRA